MSSPKEFNQNFKKLLQKVRDKQEAVCRVVALELASGMVQKSPVDTGRFKNNWFASIGTIDQSTTTTTDSTGGGSVARASAKVKDFKVGNVIYITNSLPYAKPLEYGHSKQAPNGMVRLTVAEYAQKLREIVEKLK